MREILNTEKINCDVDFNDRRKSKLCDFTSRRLPQGHLIKPVEPYAKGLRPIYKALDNTTIYHSIWRWEAGEKEEEEEGEGEGEEGWAEGGPPS